MAFAHLILFPVMGGLSILGSIFLMLVYLFTKGGSRPFKRVFWMSLCDLGLSLKFVITLIPEANVSMEQNEFACLFSAIFGTFCTLATLSWYFMISICVYAVFQPPESQWRLLSEYEVLQHGYVWTISTFAGLLPWWTGHYGTIESSAQCWIPGDGDPMKLTVAAPLYFYLLFDFYLLIYVYLMSKNSFNFRKRIKEQMFVFAGVFAIAWIWPAIAMTWDFISAETLPKGLQYMNVGVKSGSGLFNFIVWLPQACPSDLCNPKKRDNSDLKSTTYQMYSAPFDEDNFH